MNPAKEMRNVADSVRQRLLDLARRQGVDFNLVLQRYAIERFLYRLGISDQVDRFTLKGATLFLVWAGEEYRPTRDIDLLGVGLEDPAAIRRAMEAICAVPSPEDGVVFDPASIRIEDIRDQQEFGGLRVRLRGSLGRARLALQVDIGFGDAITPGREEQDYPTLLGHPAPRLWAYPRETFVAEKFEAMVRLGRPNSRVKDFWDVASLARHFAFDGETLRSAIDETFRRRGTKLAAERPEALRPAFYEDAVRARRWQEFQRQVEAGQHGPARLVDAGEEVRRLLGPVCDSLIEGEPFTLAWPAGGPWQPAEYTGEGGEGHV
jgi:hypothetical protein